MSEMNALGLVTAAGTSTRMGGFPKPLLPFDGEHFIERILGQYTAANVSKQLVVLGYEADIIKEQADFGAARVTINNRYETGMLSSVLCGVRDAQEQGCDGMFLWPTDYACVPSKIVTDLWETYEATNADVIIPQYNGERGHPALFAASTFDDLLRAPPNEGARAVVYDEATTVIDMETDDRRILVDIDTPEEYWDATKRYAFGYNAGEES